MASCVTVKNAFCCVYERGITNHCIGMLSNKHMQPCSKLTSIPALALYLLGKNTKQTTAALKQDLWPERKIANCFLLSRLQ